MQSVHVKGPWAFYEHRHREQADRIHELQCTNEEQQKQYQETHEQNRRLSAAFNKMKEELDDLTERLRLSEESNQEFQGRLEKQTNHSMERVDELIKKIEVLSEEKEQLLAENEVMKVEIKNHLMVKQSTQEKMKQMKVEIGLTSSESKHLIQELESVKLKNEDFCKTNDQLTAESALLRDQCKQHSRHCLLLIKENKRLMEQISSLKSRVESLASPTPPPLT